MYTAENIQTNRFLRVIYYDHSLTVSFEKLCIVMIKKQKLFWD